ncbi:YdcF family protein [Heliobacterium chlorum]|uniref:YdcF family protein n=1 Tax=Heliobacterium chlorum TaxID=2698 RepID=A0ABR7T5K4_HELCL|nr:YdcF family protein [Heliobacterium chlorum]MBC9785362.1 YdcF family protein [Heliobacterium chlorum]
MARLFKSKLLWILVALSTLLLMLRFAGDFLVLADEPTKADAIIVLSGDDGGRTERAVELYHQGYAPYIILSGGRVYQETTMAELMQKHAIKLGVPKEAIILENKSSSTYQNAAHSKEIMEKYQFKSAIVVSSNYHMRRTKLVFEQVFQGTSDVFAYVPFDNQDYNPARWWEKNRGIMVTITEYIKLIGYVLRMAT